MNLERCKLNKKPDADRVDICYAESNLQRAQVCHYSLVVIRTVLNHSNYHRNAILMAVSTRGITPQFARSGTTIIIGKS